jgi:manganese/zinc/iron transport system permease protein
MNADLQYTLIILTTGALVASGCALLGTFLVLRKMSLVGDAISHAILPGIAIGFALTHSRNSLVMLIGAGIAGLITVWLVELLYRSRRVYEDTSIAIVFPALFALGVIFMERYAHYVDLDPDCVIYGDIEYAPLDRAVIAGVDFGPRSLWRLGIITLLNLGFVLLCYKELKLCTFDPALAESLAYSPSRMHYLLMSAVSITTVMAFESVGAILVVAFLIVPAAAAYLLTDRLALMLVLAVVIGVVSSTTGYFVAREEVLDCSVSGAMASMAGFWFVLVWLLAPRHGLLATLFRRRRLRKQFAGDLLLIHLGKVGTLHEVDALSHDRLGWDPRFNHAILNDLERRGLVAERQGALVLTAEGEAAVEALGREHRAR